MIHVLFLAQTGDVSDHYPIEFELLGKMKKHTIVATLELK